MLSFGVEVFGTTYTVQMGTVQELGLEKDTSGDCDFLDKVIHVRTDVELDSNSERREKAVQSTFCHEMAHAFLHESGLCDYACNEVIVQWLEVNSQKFVDIVRKQSELVSDKFRLLDKNQKV